MSTRHFFLWIFVIAAALSLVSCGGESPLSPSTTPTTAGVNQAPDVTGVFTSASNARGGQPKVTICHIPPGNPANAHEITVGAPAVPAHVAHGDNVGACVTEPPPPPVCDPVACSQFLDFTSCTTAQLQCVWFEDPATEQELCTC